MINKYNETYQIHNTIKTQSNTRKCKLLIINSNFFFLPVSRNNHRHSLWKHCVQLCNPNPSPLLWELNLCEWLPCKKYGIQRANSKKKCLSPMIKSVYICHTFGKTGSTRFMNSTAKVNSKTENNGTIIYTVTSPSCFFIAHVHL